MADWSRITPSGPVRQVEAQRQRVLDLREQIPQRRDQRDAAAARVTALEREDRTRMAELMAAGKEAASDVKQIETARAAAAGAVRTAQALDLAIEDAERQLHQLVLKHRDGWAKQAERDVAETRVSAREALGVFEAALRRHREARVVEMWLREDSGLDREQVPRPAVLGPAASSAKVTANSAPVDLTVVFSWLSEALAEPQPRTLVPSPLG